MQVTSAAVIVAAGSSRRMQGRDKLWVQLAGRATLAHTIDTFQSSPVIDTIVIVTNAERLPDVHALCQHEDWHKVIAIIPGGARRQDSVRCGLDEVARQVPGCQWVMIHDAARPFVTGNILEAGLQAALKHQAAIAAVPVKDTIKQVHEGIITETPDRALLWAVQTPQVFSFPLIHEAHHTPLAQEDMTDDATLLERLGHHVAVFPGSYTNIKITTQEDLLFAEVFMTASQKI
ncbi:2-C-methyl-D-erythritol 4-phosphate cytidylyltransferase [Ktedonospora formicarum]|uniref:2-C-methyl-D-erythritol 4-phosphate cytidylyltransferase n=1 Tax=Ktedonospora formicarum TaxID=2778364 RepID=A0A8J3I1S5_9CHLR|nr:2-C-methyl-D-erythritol 4-phosphate cytidylyltransferase [Ktedonospora formicarum]GHO45128.1 2-C-methyl-D-erythritol 4-phosphate cytidylyltransferase [Ktedonospora formicarum]